MNPDHSPTPRVNWVAVVTCTVLIIGWMLYSSYRWPSLPAPVPTPVPAAATVAAAPSAPATASSSTVKPSAASAVRAPEEKTVLENDLIRATLTTYGGGIAGIELKQHALAKGASPVILNSTGSLPNPDEAAPLPVFALIGWDEETAPFTSQADPSGRSATFARVLSNGARLERTYTLSDKGYTVTLEERLANPGKDPLTLPAHELQIGTAGPLYAHDTARDVTANYIAGEGGYHHEQSNSFTASNGFAGIGARTARAVIETPAAQTPVAWAAVKNRFFALVVQPQDPKAFTGLTLRPQHGSALAPVPAIEAQAKLGPVTLAPGETRTSSYLLYAGPKDHSQLTALGRGEQAIMEYGWWGFMAIPLAKVMEWIHRYIPNYGWTIVALTLLLKAALWKFQSAANHSMKKMQALGPKQKELADKYKDEPQKMQMETMKLYREYGVNPLGSCLPILIQIPIFLGFYTMLQSAGQLQHQSWLWVKDLVQPDTVAIIPGLGLPLNPLPIMMAFTQWVVMRLTPQPNAAANPQMKIMQWMPFVMMCVLYNFAAALALYWTTNNLVSIAQTYRNLKKPVPVLTRVKKAPLPSWAAKKAKPKK